MEIVQRGWITALCVSGVAAASWMIQYRNNRTKATMGVVITPPSCDDIDCALAVQWRPTKWGFLLEKPIQ